MKKETKENITIVALVFLLFATMIITVARTNKTNYETVMSSYKRAYYDGACSALESILLTGKVVGQIDIDVMSNFKRDSAEYSELLKQVFKIGDQEIEF